MREILKLGIDGINKQNSALSDRVNQTSDFHALWDTLHLTSMKFSTVNSRSATGEHCGCACEVTDRLRVEIRLWRVRLRTSERNRGVKGFTECTYVLPPNSPSVSAPFLTFTSQKHSTLFYVRTSIFGTLRSDCSMRGPNSWRHR